MVGDPRAIRRVAWCLPLAALFALHAPAAENPGYSAWRGPDGSGAAADSGAELVERYGHAEVATWWWETPNEGQFPWTPQGAVISPLLANVYLHYVLDLWIDWWRNHFALGDVVVIRYADDFVLGFQHERDARSCLEELRERFGRFGLTLHPDKTRLIEFGTFAARQRKRRGEGKPESFDFLGFTHSCSVTRKGRFFVRRKSMAKRMRAKLADLKTILMRWRHMPIPAQGAWLKRVVQGWYNYHAVPYNIKSLSRFHYWVSRTWWRALRRRSQRARKTLWWPRMRKIIDRWLPVPRITPPWPHARFAVKHTR